MLLISSGQLFAQSGSDGSTGPEGPEGPTGITYNYLTEKIHSSNTSSSQAMTTYFDGLGRELQTQISFPNHADIVSCTEYDTHGRVSKQYLPAPSSGVSGYDPNAKRSQQAFYRAQYNSDYGYSQLVYDNTVKNTVIETSLPGDSWRLGGGHTQRTGVRKNTAADKLKDYSIEKDTTVVLNGIYAANQLIRNETIDPQGDKVYQYYNTQEQLIAEEVRTESGSLFTHYLYDDLGLLRYVLPPMADAAFSSNGRKNLQELKAHVLTPYFRTTRSQDNEFSRTSTTSFALNAGGDLTRIGLTELTTLW